MIEKIKKKQGHNVMIEKIKNKGTSTTLCNDWKPKPREPKEKKPRESSTTLCNDWKDKKQGNQARHCVMIEKIKNKGTKHDTM